MIKVILKSSVLIKNAPLNKIEWLKNELTFDNPKYVQAEKNGRFIGAGTPRYLKFYKERGSSLIVPRGMCATICKRLNVEPSTIKDFTVSPKIKIKFTGKLRPYQDKAVGDVLARRYGILEAATGAGKTVMGTAIAVHRGVRTLIIVHNRELLNQWVSAFETFTDIRKKDIGIIGGGKFDIGDVTIGIINSIHKKADEIKKEFGLVIYDECHRTLGNTWITTINTLRPKFHVGLSATPFRSDGTTKALFRVVGPLLHKVNKKHLESTGAILIPEIIKENTKFSYNFNNDYSTMLSALTQHDDRNVQIANNIIKEFKRNKEPIMVVSDRVTHCEVLRWLLENEAGIKPVVLSGRLPKEYRRQAIEDLRAGYYNILIATISLLGEGFDAPGLNSVFLTTPIKFSGRVLQTIGRVLRPSENGSMPRVYDFRDNLVPVLRYSGFARDKVYKKQGWG